MRDTISNQKLCKKILERNRKYNDHLEIKTYQSARHRFLFPRDSKGNKEPHYERAAAEEATKSWLAFLDRYLK
jgi:dienelactone hydrolase